MESGAATAAGEGETTKEAGVSETAQQEPEKEEPRGPRPTSSVPVPGNTHYIVCSTTVGISVGESPLPIYMAYPSHYCTSSWSLLAYLQ